MSGLLLPALTRGRLPAASLPPVPRRLLAATSSSADGPYDCVVSGGGLVGSAVALALNGQKSLADKRILVLEAFKPKDYAFPASYSNRVSAVNEGSRKLFQDLGAWKTIQDFRCKPIRGMHVWDSDGSVLSFPPSAEDSALFHIVENDLMVHSLGERLKDAGNVAVGYGKGIKSITTEEDGRYQTVTLSGKDGSQEEVLETRLVIGADGANSTVRKLAFKSEENPYVSWNYDQMGVVANLRLSSPIPNNMAWQKFVVGSGPIALLPLSEESCSLVWTLPTKKAQRAMKLPPEEFVRELRAALGKFPAVADPRPDIIEASQIAGFPLGLGHSSRYCSPGVVLVGDAAHRVHPLAGQGVNLGFGDSGCLATELSRGVALGEPFASHGRLLDYETARQRSNLPVMAGIDFLQKVYDVDFAPLGAARSLGVAAVNSSPVLKQFFAGLASG